MKNCIWKGLCLFFIMLPILMTIVILPFSAQSGHGGTTEVIARIEEPTTAESQAPTQPFTESATSQSSVTSQDAASVQTGSAILWVVLTALSLVAALLLIVLLRRGRKQS